jgi:hypothetical protein
VQVRGLPALVVAVAFVVGGCASSHAADAPSRVEQAAQLRVLERPAARSIKLTFIALTLHRDVRAAAQLARAGERSEAILSWVDDHRSFARANEASIDCFDEPQLGGGNLSYVDKGGDVAKFVANTQGPPRVNGTSATWSGTGTWTHADGSTQQTSFQVTTVDNGSSDRFSIAFATYSKSGPLAGGNITIR